MASTSAVRLEVMTTTGCAAASRSTTSAIPGKRSGLGTAPNASSTWVTTSSGRPAPASASNQFVSVKSRKVDRFASLW